MLVYQRVLQQNGLSQSTDDGPVSCQTAPLEDICRSFCPTSTWRKADATETAISMATGWLLGGKSAAVPGTFWDAIQQIYLNKAVRDSDKRG